MAQTVIPYGSPQALKIQSAGLFAAAMQRQTTLNRLAGPMPSQADAENNLRLQSSNNYPVVRVLDLLKKAGDEVSFDLINPIGGKPIMGERYAEGLGDKMSFSNDSVRINQTRKPISAGGKMTQQRTPHQLRSLARALGLSYMTRLEDQLTLVHAAGSRGFANDIEWVVPLAADAEFSDICINTIRAPSRNRHFKSSAGTDLAKYPTTAYSGEIASFATTDVMNITVIDALRTKLDGMPLPPPPVLFDNDQLSADAPMRVLLVSSEQYTSIVQSTNFRTLQAYALARANMAKQSPIFLGEAGLWNGILVVKMPKPIRFYAGNQIKYCTSSTSNTEVTTDIVPAAFGTTYAVDRAILLGGQAIAEAWGMARQTENPYFWSEKELDHGDKLEILVGMIAGKSKIQFLIDQGNQTEYTDFGVMAIDTAVKIA